MDLHVSENMGEHCITWELHAIRLARRDGPLQDSEKSNKNFAERKHQAN